MHTILYLINLAKHYKAIELGDLAKIFAYFDRSSPVALQDEIVLAVIYYVGQRGREGLRQLNRNSYNFRKDSQGREFVESAHGMSS